MRLFSVSGLLSAVMMLVSACGTIPVPAGYSAAFTCQREIGAVGTYRVPTGVDFPVVEPVQDGTQAGADAINACIRSRAQQGAVGASPLPDVAGGSQRVETVRAGNTVTETYTYGTPPAAKAASTPARQGGTGGRYCNPLTGGTGYGCARP